MKVISTRKKLNLTKKKVAARNEYSKLSQQVKGDENIVLTLKLD